MIECRFISCQHPIGPHVHVIVPDDETVTRAMLQLFGIDDELYSEVDAVKKLAVDGNEACKSAIREAPSQGNVFVIYKITAKPDEKVAVVNMMFLKVDREFGIPGREVAEMFRKNLL